MISFKSTQLNVRSYQNQDEQNVINLILKIQREEFDIDITVDDQPDLKSIPSFYQNGIGGFWVATIDDNVVGTIALKDIGNGRGALRKMFVDASVRGTAHGIAAFLLRRLLDDSIPRGAKRLYLGTTEKFVAAHRFYEREGFEKIEETDLPTSFPRMIVDTRFYELNLTKRNKFAGIE
ncbi:GNAT family N-acetyltransferase [Pseudomonas sp. C1C7]|uniref:GNAT family N-acetyltransferase n=1 Tax=Pseudomonas sp. C1C7 TaxID=2735272 RepID=UPI0015866AD0|nr:GNAT family N-acetyltransferase [Pseudomonas sp. C1C7]NUT76815.1 GNAT family N-acetyltransferase [Pseudomonas sp. C1C7]